MFAIKLLRSLLGISQGELSRRSGVSLRELARIEKAEVLPRREAIQSIDRALVESILDRAKSAAATPRRTPEDP